jgi:hypothetical protein
MVSGSSPDGRAKGDIAQLVEQWIENPCVTGSIPVITTTEDWLSGLKRHPAKVLYWKRYRRFESFIFRFYRSQMSSIWVKILDK